MRLGHLSRQTAIRLRVEPEGLFWKISLLLDILKMLISGSIYLLGRRGEFYALSANSLIPFYYLHDHRAQTDVDEFEIA